MLSDGDTWFGVHDKRLRKRIQDRLAQRARRQRLQQSRNQEAVPDSRIVSSQRISKLNHQALSSEHRQPILRNSTEAFTLTLAQDTHYLPRPNASIFSALFNNGRLLGIPCSYCGLEKSKPTQLSVPYSLRATQLQINVAHRTFIDRFPFPAFRNNLIYFDALIDMEQFLDDLFNLYSFSLEFERPPWDPRAWRIGPEFEKKWGYLFYEESCRSDVPAISAVALGNGAVPDR